MVFFRKFLGRVLVLVLVLMKWNSRLCMYFIVIMLWFDLGMIRWCMCFGWLMVRVWVMCLLWCGGVVGLVLLFMISIGLGVGGIL